MTILTLPPLPAFQTARFGLRSNTQIFTSPLSGATQTLELAGAAWTLEAKVPPLQDQDLVADWSVFMVQLRGQSGRFYGGDPQRKTARGAPTGTPQVAGASQTGTSLMTDGWTPSTLVLKKNDHFAFANGAGRRELKKIVANVTSDSGGSATLTFEPPIRSSPADNAALIVSSATCIMMLTDSAVGWDEAEAAIHGFTLSAVEALFG